VLQFTLSYDGGLADNNAVDLYDGARALAGFQRSLALVTHLALNGEIITQAPSLAGAQIISHAPEEGSWKVVATVVAGVFAVTSVGKDSPMGQLVTSIYDYVLYETMGFHVDYSKTLQQQIAEHEREKKITREKLDSLMEKTESSIADMHRPIVASKTATGGHVSATRDHVPPQPLGPEMSDLTYEYIVQSVRSEEELDIVGVVSSYNINTFKGRIFVFEEQRPIPFELLLDARTRRNVNLITESLRRNADNQQDPSAAIILRAHRVETRNGRLKTLLVTEVSQARG